MDAGPRKGEEWRVLLWAGKGRVLCCAYLLVGLNHHGAVNVVSVWIFSDRTCEALDSTPQYSATVEYPDPFLSL